MLLSNQFERDLLSKRVTTLRITKLRPSRKMNGRGGSISAIVSVNAAAYLR
jgi:hypothetical protein